MLHEHIHIESNRVGTCCCDTSCRAGLSSGANGGYLYGMRRGDLWQRQSTSEERAVPRMRAVTDGCLLEDDVSSKAGCASHSL